MASKSSMQTDITQIEIQQAISRASIALNRNEKTHAQMAVGKYENMLIEATDSAKVKALFAADTTKTTEVKQRVYNAVVNRQFPPYRRINPHWRLRISFYQTNAISRVKAHK